MATIRTTAQRLSIPPKKLLSEFSKKFPEQTWTLDSETPEGFDEAASTHAQEYAEASGVKIPKGQLTNIPDALKDNRLILESIEYGVLEALSQMRSARIVESAQIEAISDIQDYESAYNRVWEGYFTKKAQTLNEQSEALSLQKLAKVIQLNCDLGERQGELIRFQEQLKETQANSQAQTQKALDALLK